MKVFHESKVVEGELSESKVHLHPWFKNPANKWAALEFRPCFYKPTNQGQPPLWKSANQEGTYWTKHASDCQPINNSLIGWRQVSVPFS